MSKDSQPTLSRRRVFAGAGTAGALAAAAVVVPMAQSRREADKTAQADDSQGRYRETAHVLHYYQTAKV